MSDNFIKEIRGIREILSGKLKPERYEHSLSVSYTAVCLAMRYGADLSKAELAGLLHDCAKQFSNSRLIELCREADIPLSEDFLRSPQVIHAEYGFYYARKAFGIDDPDILSAIRFHTLGRADMTLLEKIIFTADYIEVRRDKQDRLPEIRKLAFTDLDRCVYEILHDTVNYLSENGGFICGDSLITYHYYQKLMEERNDKQ